MTQTHHDKLTCVIPTHNRPAFLRRLLSFVEQTGQQFPIQITDSSDAARRAELEAYHPLVCPGSYVVATDGVIRQASEVPRGEKNWNTNNPAEAVREFLKLHDEFVLEQPEWPFNESELTENVTHWPEAWLRRVV